MPRWYALNSPSTTPQLAQQKIGNNQQRSVQFVNNDFTKSNNDGNRHCFIPNVEYDYNSGRI